MRSPGGVCLPARRGDVARVLRSPAAAGARELQHGAPPRRPWLRGRHRRSAGSGRERHSRRRLHAHARRRGRRQRVRHRSGAGALAGCAPRSASATPPARCSPSCSRPATAPTTRSDSSGSASGGHERFALTHRGVGSGTDADASVRDRRPDARTLRPTAARAGRLRRRRSCSVGWRCPSPVLDALGSVKSSLLGVVGLTSMIPGSVAREMAAVDVPVFLGLGEHDIAGDPQRDPRLLRRVTRRHAVRAARRRSQPQRGSRPGGALGPARHLGRAGPAGFVVSASRSVATGGTRCRRSPSRS